MRGQQGGSPAQSFMPGAQRLNNLLFRVNVQRRERIIKQQHARANRQGTRQRKPLPLTTREAQPLFANNGIDPFGKVVHEIAGRDREGGAHTLIRLLRRAKIVHP